MSVKRRRERGVGGTRGTTDYRTTDNQGTEGTELRPGHFAESGDKDRHLRVHPEPQNATWVSAGMNVPDSLQGLCPNARGVARGTGFTEAGFA